MAIHIDLINLPIPHAYVDQANTYEEFKKIGINQVNHHNTIIAKAPILNY
jgi:hypothetical protein